MAIAEAGRRLVAGGTRTTLAGAAVLAGAAAATLADGPVWLRTAAWLMGTLAVGSVVAVARRRRSERNAQGDRGVAQRPGVDPLLVALTVVVAAAVASGFVLNAAGVRLSSDPWALTLAAAGVAVLVVARPRRTAGARPATENTPATENVPATEGSPPHRRSSLVSTAVWSSTAVAVVGVSFVVAVAGANEADVPPVAMSVRDLEPTSVDVVVGAPGDAGPYEIRTDGGVSSTLSYPPVTVTGGEPASTTVLLPPEGKVTVTLHNVGQAEPLRTVVIDR